MQYRLYRQPLQILVGLGGLQPAAELRDAQIAVDHPTERRPSLGECAGERLRIFFDEVLAERSSLGVDGVRRIDAGDLLVEVLALGELVAIPEQQFYSLHSLNPKSQKQQQQQHTNHRTQALPRPHE